MQKTLLNITAAAWVMLQACSVSAAEDEVIARVYHGCSGERIYSINPAQVDEKRKEWLRTTIAFTYSGNQIRGFVLEDSVNYPDGSNVMDNQGPVSCDEIQERLRFKEYAEFVGADVSAHIAKLCTLRGNYARFFNDTEEGKKILAETSTHLAGYLEHPFVKSYMKEQEDLNALVIKKFGIHQELTEPDCE